MARYLPRLILAGVLMTAGCDRSSPSPAAPTPAPNPGAGPAASFKVTVDAAGSQDALTGVSEITVDAGASTGSGVKYLVDFGDGARATEPIARHVYDKAGTYRITVTLTDATGRTDTASRELAVASPLGAWLYSAYIARTRTVDVRTLSLTAQEGSTVRGVLSRAGTTDSPITGRLTPDRRISLTVDRLGETLEGVVPSVLSPNVAAWTLAARGGPADGETLIFRARPGDPTGPGPDASLHMRFFSFSAPFGIKQISPIRFDASPSRGEGLTYFIEFGDGQVSQTATAVHPIDKVGEYTARLTVVDRYGRANSETTSFEVQSLIAEVVSGSDGNFWQGGRVSETYTPDQMNLFIHSQNGTAITGTLQHLGPQGGRRTFSGTADADGTVRLVLSDSAGTLAGTLTLGPANLLDLTFVGGPNNGERFKLHLRSLY